MNLEGVKIEGARYGGLTPLDYGGLQAWYKATDGVKLYTGNQVKSWDDLSGNNRHLTAINRGTLAQVNSAGNLINTSNGLAYSNDNGTAGLSCITDYTFKKMLYDGRPMTCITVFKITTFVTSTGFRFLASSISTSGNGFFQHGAPTASYPIRTLNQGTIIANNDMVNAFTGTGGHVVSVIDIGYVSSSSTQHRRAFLDGVENNRRKFTSAPSTLDDSTSPFSLQASSNNALYEVILYDNTGKSEQQILDEHSRLITEYINPRYPNLYTS